MSISIADLRNAWRRDIDAAVASIAHPRFTTVSDVDPANGLVRLVMQPEGTTSGWVPDGSFGSAGGGFGVISPAHVGDQMVVMHMHGDADNPIPVGRIHSQVDKITISPVNGDPVQPGEYGCFLPDGTYLHCVGGNWHFKGNLVVEGNITSTNGDVSDKRGSVDRLRGNYDGHDHKHSVGQTTKPDSE